VVIEQSHPRKAFNWATHWALSSFALPFNRRSWPRYYQECRCIARFISSSIKSEVISRSGDVFHPQFIDFHQLSLDNASLLGAPISAGQTLNDSLSAMYGYLEVAGERLQLIYTNEALILLKSCLGGAKHQYVLRTSPCCGHSILTKFDDLLRSAVTKMCNASLTDDQWTQASLPVWSAGLGIRSVSKLASTAFFASAAGSRILQT